ncbi:protein Atossa [Drosophila tropicalis]|uniref:protein Atossa n=1 Tax=Drosophila tropicalis TaxID=46794 RepID=UPI0035AC280D
MIPTSVTNSPPPAGLAQNGASVSVLGAAAGVGGGLGITITGPGTVTAGNGAGGGAAAATAQNNYNSIVLGLASLILEGRPISDDEYQHQVGKGAGGSNGATATSSGSTGTGRLSPRPSTSRAAINITTNPYNLASTPRSSYNGLGVGGGGGTSSSGNNSSNNTTTHQRWTQKLCQLRQVSPAAQSMSMEPELVALAINDVATEHSGVGGGGGGTGSSSGEFEIVRRVLLNRAGLGGGGGLGAVGSGGGGTNNSSAASSPGSNSSDNILHSLQSLATTCLRGGSGPIASNNLNLPLPMPMSVAMPLPQSGETRPFSLDFGYIPPSRSTITAAAASSNSPSNATATTTTAATSTVTNSRPKHGPHCDQFLRKMGLAKGLDLANDNEEHFCDMSYVNITCSRWRAYCLKMDAILARREPGICIEVYLGPVSHKILLEQWIITSKEKVPPPTMTLPSLCSAIRSQLYFSQIVAWCDLLRKCDPSVYDSGRVIFANGNGNNAGDLATTTTASSSTTSSPSQSSSSSSSRRPRLNIFYRIKHHDPNGGGGGAAGLDGGFNTKANVHNFPYVNIAENISISVCVKSLPRINGGLPQVGPAPVPPQRMLRAACTPTNGGGFQAATPTGLGARTAIVGASPGNGLARTNCDKNKAKSSPKEMVELLAEEEDDQLGRDDLDGSGGSLSHRERQLQKYRKRMQRRDKKRERKSSLERQPMEQEVEDLEPEQEPMEEEAQAMVMTLAQPRRIAMISTGTQTSLSSCQQCGREKTLLCLNCSSGEDDHSDDAHAHAENGQAENDNEDTGGSGSEMEDISSCSLSSGDLIVGTPRNNAELLLQAIQRTPKNRQSRDLNRGSRAVGGGVRNNNQPKAAASSGGCQLCKRQKTQHHFAQAKQEQIKQETPIPTNDGHQMEEEEVEQQSIASTKLTPNIERCSLNAITERCQTPPLPLEGTNNLAGQFKTPQLKLDTHSPLPMPTLLTLARPMPTKPSQLRLNCTGSGLPQIYDNETPPPTTSPLLRKALPKVNLTTIFCSSAPITIGSSSSTSQPSSSSMAFCFDPSTLSHVQSQLIPSDLGNNLTVQKSFSAPTLPHVANSSSSSTLSISPRFAKQAAAASFYKRRSRHLSDRSDRSSLGSDEQLSDEDLESAGMFSPAGSPMKCRSRLVSQFAHRPLLGNLEESLLQRRLMPKIEVQGFKLLLGASGGFCPTQLTIPAASYFYELHGETLSTPYMCEIRMPRKGYSVPRTGTLQATLLNPMGTVVRMFVIPYDMRDMPPLHRTFIRQRILAEEANPCLQQQQQQQAKEQVQPRSPTTTSTTSKLGHFITAEQMKRLRYSIHLRFQTSRSGRLSLHTDIRLLISRRTDCDTAAAHAKGVLEAPNELITDTLMPQEPRYSSRQESSSASSKI